MKVFGFSEKDATRIKSAVARFEHFYRNAPPARGRYPVAAGGASLIPIAITSNVTAGSRAAPTTFNCTIEVPTGSGGGLTITGGVATTCYNRFPGVAFSASSGSPKEAWAISFSGALYLVSADC